MIKVEIDARNNKPKGDITLKGDTVELLSELTFVILSITHRLAKAAP